MNSRDTRGTPGRGRGEDLSRDVSAGKRTRRSSQRRLVRTIVLGTLAVFAAIAWLASELGMDTGELLGYALTSLMMVAGVVVLALAGAALLRLVGRLTGRN